MSRVSVRNYEERYIQTIIKHPNFTPGNICIHEPFYGTTKLVILLLLVCVLMADLTEVNI